MSRHWQFLQVPDGRQAAECEAVCGCAGMKQGHSDYVSQALFTSHWPVLLNR